MALAESSPVPGVLAQDFGSTTTRNLASAGTNIPAVMLLLSAAYYEWYAPGIVQGLSGILSTGVMDGSTHYSAAYSQDCTFSGGALSSATPYPGVVLTKRTNVGSASEAIASVDFWPFATIASITSMTGYVGQIA